MVQYCNVIVIKCEMKGSAYNSVKVIQGKINKNGTNGIISNLCRHLHPFFSHLTINPSSPESIYRLPALALPHPSSFSTDHFSSTLSVQLSTREPCGKVTVNLACYDDGEVLCRANLELGNAGSRFFNKAEWTICSRIVS